MITELPASSDYKSLDKYIEAIERSNRKRIASGSRKEYFKKYYANPDNFSKTKDRSLKRYGITWEQKCSMWHGQKGLCGLCEQALPSEIGAACVDHDHVTGAVRKLVHRQCNVLIAQIENTPDMLQKISKYLGQENAVEIKTTGKMG